MQATAEDESNLSCPSSVPIRKRTSGEGNIECGMVFVARGTLRSASSFLDIVV
jgi:hypothetical protein